MTISTPDVLALCQAIDEGDDSALPALADALEEMDDPRAAGLRVAADGTEIVHIIGSWGGYYYWQRGHTFAGADYPTRSAAFLALAAALSQE